MFEISSDNTHPVLEKVVFGNRLTSTLRSLERLSSPIAYITYKGYTGFLLHILEVTHMANYNPRTKRVLNDYGEFVPFKEDMKKSEEMLEASGTTRESMLIDQKLKREAYRGSSKESVVAGLSEAELEHLLNKKRASTAENKPAIEKLDTKPETPIEKLDTKPKPANNVDIHTLTLPELKAHAKEIGIPFRPNASKSKMIELFEGPTGSSEKLDSSEEEDEL